MPYLAIGSIASSGRPPLPAIARTPWLRPSGSVKRTMRALVVVPTHIGSYLPGPSLRTFGAVWSRKAPSRSSGGSTPWSKIRICVRSRMPRMWPSTVTRSPAWSLRMSSSLAGNVSLCSAIASERGLTPFVRSERAFGVRARNRCVSEVAHLSELPVEIDMAVRGDVGARSPRGPALVVDGHRVQGHVRVRVLDVAREDGHVSAEAHRADTRLVEQLEELPLELRHLRIPVRRPDRPPDRLLREVHRVVRRAADPDAHDPRRARLAARADDRLEDELLDPLHPIGGDAHLQEAHVFRAGALRNALHVEPIPFRHELPVHDRQPVPRVGAGVLARQSVHSVRAQRRVERRALGADLQRLVDLRRVQRKVLADAARVDGDPRVR